MLSASLLLLSGIAAGWTLARKFDVGGARFWQQRADYWFERAMTQDAGPKAPEFHHHPLFHATRRYPSIDALLVAASGRYPEAKP